MKTLFFCWIIFLFISISTISCNDTLGKKRTNRELERLKGEVCLTITEEYKYKSENNEDELANTTITKFNKNGNYIYIKRNDNINTAYSYDEKGKLLVEKTDNYTFDMTKKEFVNLPIYKKYSYDSHERICKIEEYSYSAENLNSISMIERSGTMIKFIKVEPKYDTANGTSYNDTTITAITRNKLRNPIEIRETRGKRNLVTTYTYNKNNQRIRIHTEDMVKYIDSTVVYEFSKEIVDYTKPKYMYNEINVNVTEEYNYDEYGNISHQMTWDNVTNKKYEEYRQYVYDEQGNWIKCSIYNPLHELISYFVREIEYYPLNHNTGLTDYTWEQEDSPALKRYYYAKTRKVKEQQYLNENFVLEQFHYKMKQEYPQYTIANPKITYHSDSTYHINFNGYYYSFGLKFSDNYTVRIIMCIDAESYYFDVIKGTL